MPGTKLISVVIPAFNEEDNIAICLASLAHQKTKRPLEVIVVDNNSTDRTAEIAGKFKDILNVRVIAEKQKGRGAARFAGFRAAKGDIIFSTDADAIVPPEWIEKYMEKFEKKPNVVAITGIPNIQDCAPFRNTAFNLTVPQFLKLNWIMYGHPGLSGFSFAIKRKAYEIAGGFNPVADCYEDLELAHRVHKVGKILLITDPPVIFSGRRFQKGLIAGYLEYLKPFIEVFILKKKRAKLENYRPGQEPVQKKKKPKKVAPPIVIPVKFIKKAIVSMAKSQQKKAKKQERK